MVPRMRAAPVQLRLVDDLSRREALAGDVVRDQEAAGELVLGIEQRPDLGEGEVLLEQPVCVGPSGGGAGHERHYIVREEVGTHLLVAKRVRDPVTQRMT